MISPIGETARCFMSHAWKDGGHAFALQVWEHLRLRGIDSWIDEKSIQGGQHLECSIRLGVLKRTNVFLAVLTEAWKDSPACQEELLLAVERRDKCGVQIIPILRESVRERPEGLEDSLYVDFRDDDRMPESLDKLIDAINSAFFVYSMVTRLVSGTRHERWQAAQHLGVLGNPFVLPVLIARLAHETDPVVRHWVAIAVAKTPGALRRRALEETLARETNEFAKSGIRAALKMTVRPRPDGMDDRQT